eukprot:1768879-Prymnesium_polylepis.1
MARTERKAVDRSVVADGAGFALADEVLRMEVTIARPRRVASASPPTAPAGRPCSRVNWPTCLMIMSMRIVFRTCHPHSSHTTTPR